MARLCRVAALFCGTLSCQGARAGANEPRTCPTNNRAPKSTPSSIPTPSFLPRPFSLRRAKKRKNTTHPVRMKLQRCAQQKRGGDRFHAFPARSLPARSVQRTGLSSKNKHNFTASPTDSSPWQWSRIPLEPTTKIKGQTKNCHAFSHEPSHRKPRSYPALGTTSVEHPFAQWRSSLLGRPTPVPAEYSSSTSPRLPAVSKSTSSG